MLACTPYGVEELEFPSDAEAEQAELEPVFTRFPDADREDPFETHAEDLRCWDQQRPDQAWEVTDLWAEPDTGMLAVELNGKILALPLQATRFDTVVVGTVAETEVTQVFANPFDEPIEAVYMFPLHERAAVDDYWLTIGERTIRGKMQTREQARQTYEDAKREGRTAGLLEQDRPNVFNQHVANIMPGEAIEVSIHLVQPLEQDHGVFSLVLPTVVGPRYIPGAPNGQGGTDRVPDADKVSAPMIPAGYTTCADVEVSVALESGLRPRALQSRFHAIDIRREGDVAFVELDRDAGPVLANRDFVLSWDLGQGQPQAAIVAQDRQGSGYFTLTVQPPELVPDEQAIPRELVFVVDNSGSMDGAPISTAKGLMHRALSELRPDDTFNVLRFSEDASGLSPTLLPATKANIEAGRDYVDAMHGMGGTEMTAGIRAALELPHDPDRIRIVLFLTDGYIGHEQEIFELVEANIADARLFSLGVGSAPNRYLLDGLAAVGRGAVSYADGQDSAAIVERFYERIETPVLSDLDIDWRGLAVAEVYPQRLPDLFAGQPLTVFGRYQGKPAGDIVVRGKANGKAVEIPVRFELARADDVAGVSSVWARNKIDALLGYPNRVGDPAAQEAVIEVALAHSIMTEFTSFVAVDQTRVANPDGSYSTVEQPLLIPEGTTHEGFGGDAYGVGGLGLVGHGSGGGSGVGYGRGGGSGLGSSAAVPKVKTSTPQIMGSIDKDLIRRIVRSHTNQVRKCYEIALTKDPNVEGRVTIKFVITADGKISAAGVSENTTKDEGLGDCIAKVVKRMTFPKRDGGGMITISYPFVLKPS